MSEFPNFLGKIPRLKDDEQILTTATFTEKIDGSYFQFGWYNGEFRYRTKKMLDYEIKDKMFDKAIEYVTSNKDLIGKDEVYCCEYLSKPKHNKITYDLEEMGDLEFVLFVIKRVPFSREPLPPLKNLIPIPIVNTLELGPRNKSAYGELREGLVAKDENGQLYKIVDESFKEVKHKPKDKTIKLVDEVFQPYLNGLDNRTDKTIFRLKEQGKSLTNKLVGDILKETVNDLLLEEKENIKEDLYKFYKKEFNKNCNKEILKHILKKIEENENDTK